MNEGSGFSIDFRNLFNNDHVVMLIVDPADGQIFAANPAAERFYGWSADELKQKKMTEINTMPPELLKQKMQRAKVFSENHFFFSHRLKSGEVRDVEITSGPVNQGERQLLYSIISDVTDRNKTAGALQRSEENFRSAFQNAATPKILLTHDLKIIRVNKAACDLLMYSSAAICQKGLSDILFEADMDLFAMAINDLASKSNVQNFLFESRFKTGGGGFAWAEVGVTRLATADEGSATFLIDLHDCALKKGFEFEVQQSQNRMQSIIKILGRGFRKVREILRVILDESINLTDSKYGFMFRYDEDTQAFKMVEWSEEVLAQCGLKDHVNIVQLSKVALLDGILTSCQPLIINDLQKVRDNNPRYPQGHVQINNLLALPVFSNGKVTAIIGLANKSSDYTQSDVLQLTLLLEAMFIHVERIEAENNNMRLQRLIRAKNAIDKILIAAVNVEDLILEVCELLVSECGFIGSMIILLNREKIPDMSAQCGFEGDRRPLPECVKNRKLPHCLFITDAVPNIPNSSAEGQCQNCFFGKFLVENDSYRVPLVFKGRDLGFLVVITSRGNSNKKDEEKLLNEMADSIKIAIYNLLLISENKLRENENIQLQQLLVHSQKAGAIGQLTSGIIHDFNNFLSVILGYGEVMKRELPPESEWLGPVEEIVAAGKRVEELTRHLMRFSRNQPFKLGVVSVNQTIRCFESILRKLAGEKIKFVFSIAEEPLNILADTAQLEQVLMNIIINARDALPGGGEITIDARKESESSNCVLISIADNGTGMSKETMGRIFEPFFSTKDPDHGTGLGLATAMHIVRAHGGQITVESELGKGTKFFVSLPATNLPLNSTAKRSATITLMSGTTILLVEDETAVRKLVSRLLKKNGYNVLTADCALNAFEVSRSFQGKIDLLLADVVMPGIEGPELYLGLIKERPEISVLFMSGYADCLTRDSTGSITPENFVPKPVAVNDLLEKISVVLASKPGN